MFKILMSIIETKIKKNIVKKTADNKLIHKKNLKKNHYNMH